VSEVEVGGESNVTHDLILVGHRPKIQCHNLVRLRCNSIGRRK
jgi:hypothetical protein